MDFKFNTPGDIGTEIIYDIYEEAVQRAIHILRTYPNSGFALYAGANPSKLSDKIEKTAILEAYVSEVNLQFQQDDVIRGLLYIKIDTKSSENQQIISIHNASSNIQVGTFDMVVSGQPFIEPYSYPDTKHSRILTIEKTNSLGVITLNHISFLNPYAVYISEIAPGPMDTIDFQLQPGQSMSIFKLMRMFSDVRYFYVDELVSEQEISINIATDDIIVTVNSSSNAIVTMRYIELPIDHVVRIKNFIPNTSETTPLMIQDINPLSVEISSPFLKQNTSYIVKSGLST